MAVITDLRTATTFTFADEAVSSSFGGLAVDLSNAAAIGATEVGQAVIEAEDEEAALTAIGAAAADLSNAAGVSTALINYADDAAAAAGGVAVGELYRTGSILKVRVA